GPALLQASSDLPEGHGRADREERHRCPAPPALLFGLAPSDACRPAVSPRPRWALTPPFQPCLIPHGPSAVCFLLRPCRIATPGRYPAPCSRSPDFPLILANQRPPTRLPHAKLL